MKPKWTEEFSGVVERLHRRFGFRREDVVEDVEYLVRDASLMELEAIKKVGYMSYGSPFSRGYSSKRPNPLRPALLILRREWIENLDDLIAHKKTLEKLEKI